MKNRVIWLVGCAIGAIQCMQASEMKDVVVAISSVESLQALSKNDVKDGQGVTRYSIEPECMAEYQRKVLNIQGDTTRREIEFFRNYRDDIRYKAEEEKMLKQKEKEVGDDEDIKSVCSFYGTAMQKNSDEYEHQLKEMKGRVQECRVYCGVSGALCVLVSIGIFCGMYVAPVCIQ